MPRKSKAFWVICQYLKLGMRELETTITLFLEPRPGEVEIVKGGKSMIRELDMQEAFGVVGGEPRNQDVSPLRSEQLAGYGGQSNNDPQRWLQQNGYWQNLNPPKSPSDPITCVGAIMAGPVAGAFSTAAALTTPAPPLAAGFSLAAGITWAVGGALLVPGACR